MAGRRRSCLVVPASERQKIEKAALLDVDEVILDLEDAVPANAKTVALRRDVAQALGELSWHAPITAIRINAVGTRWWRDDLAEVVGQASGNVRSVVVPKVEVPDELVAVDQLLGDLERRHSLAPIALEAMIETAAGLTRVEELARTTPRLVALIFGAGDYAASLGLHQSVIGASSPGYPGDSWHYPRARIAVAAHANGLVPIDTPYGAYRDVEGFELTAGYAKAVGFLGKWVIHPDQIEMCNAIFSPTGAELADAMTIVRDLDNAAESGRGAIAGGGVMLDAASIRMAIETLERGGDPEGLVPMARDVLAAVLDE